MSAASSLAATIVVRCSRPRSAAEAIEPRTRRPFYTVRCAALLDNTLDFNEFHELSEKTELFISRAVQDPLPPLPPLAPRPFVFCTDGLIRF